MAIHRGWGRRSTRVINCNSTFFFVTHWSAVSFFRCTFYHPQCNLYAGLFLCNSSPAFYFPLPATGFAFDSSISGLVQKTSPRVKLVYISNCTFFRVSPLCFYIFGKHTRMCSNIANIHLQNRFFPVHSCTRCSFFIFSAARAHDSLMVKWLYGLVWSVVCYFNFLCLLLTSLG